MATRIAFCITELNRGGAESAFVRLVRGLDRNEWNPAVFTLQSGGALGKELQGDGIPVKSVGLDRPSLALRGLRNLTNALREFRPEILQTWLYHANLVGRVAAWRAKVPHLVAGIRVAERRSRWRLRLDRWTAGRVERHVCVSQGVADFMQREAGLPRERLVVIPNGVDFPRFAHAPPAELQELGIPPLSPTVLFVGRLDPQKAPFLFLEAALMVLQVIANAHFLMVGEGPLRAEMELWIERHGLADRVHLVGWRNDLPSIFRAVSCFALSSRWEGMANVLLEAMAAGTPAVATDVEGARELVIPNETGILVPFGDAAALSAGLIEVLSDAATARRRSDAAQELVHTRFTWNKFVDSHASLYRELIIPM